MKIDYSFLKSFFLPPALPVGISFTGQLKLMEMTFARLRFGITAIPFVAIPLVWFYSQNHDGAELGLWALAYVVAALWINWLFRLFLQSMRSATSEEALVLRWRPRLNAIAILHGFGLSTAVFISSIDSNFEFGILLYGALAAIVAGNATHQTPVLGVFWRFYNASWNASVLMVYWVFPAHWQFVLPLTLIFTLAIYKNALAAHRFFVSQVVLEEHAALLATQFKAAKDEAEQALESKNLFLRTASHDLRQPVFAIGMLTGAIASKNCDQAITPLLDNLRSSVHSLNLMFNSLLDLSRIESGQAPVIEVAVDLEQLLCEVVALFEATARAAGLKLKMHLPKARITIVADPDLLRQALVNLTHNALRYTQQGGVLIGVRKHGVQWQLEVWDTGIGIADNEQEKIYSPYYRNEHAWRADATGHGLGLHVVARCAKLMKAPYGLTSRLGRGSRFWLRFDRAALPFNGQQLAGKPVQARALQSSYLVSGKCLIVDDDPQVIAAWAALLEAWHVDVRFASCAQGAFDLIHQGFLPQAIFCDQRLRSGESGFDILRDLLAKLPAARGAMVSGEFASRELLEAESEGHLVLRKPVDPEQLQAVLTRFFLDPGKEGKRGEAVGVVQTVVAARTDT